MSRSHTPRVRTLRFSLIALVLFLLSGCSLPRIIIFNDPLSAEEHNKLGGIYESQGKFDLAAREYRDALRKEPKNVTSLVLLADLSFRTRDYSEAEALYKKAAKLQPGNGDIYNNLCWVYLEQNTGLEKAEKLIGQALAVMPAHRAYYLDTRGVILMRQGRLAESIAALNESVELLPKDNAGLVAEAYGHLAEAYRAAGEEEKARESELSATRYREQVKPETAGTPPNE